MLKKAITYEDYNGDTVTEDFYFNFTKLELIELDVRFDGGLEGQIKRLTETENGRDAYYMFKDIVLSAYGIKSDDGKHFVKSPEIQATFESSPALSELIIGFLQDPTDGAKFLEACLPAKLVAEATAYAASKDAEIVKLPDATNTQAPMPRPVLNEDQISQRDLSQLSKEELIAKVANMQDKS